MHILMLCGINCTRQIWDRMLPFLSGHDTVCPDYPHEMLRCAKSPDDVARWVQKIYGSQSFDAVIGHSMGGILALRLAASGAVHVPEIICLDTNMCPANAFYRNLMTPAHMKTFGPQVMRMFEQERPFVRPELTARLRENFDYTADVRALSQTVHILYGDRQTPDYPNRISDLNLPPDIPERLDLRFVPDACHMLMMENPSGTAHEILDILKKYHPCHTPGQHSVFG